MTSFKILTEWSWAENAQPLNRETAAELTLLVDNQPLTQLLDKWSRTVTSRARVSAYPLAEWLAANWWRIRYEPGPDAGAAPTPEWRMAHDLPAIGGGYVWPGVRLVSDGESMQISARNSGTVAWESAEYLLDLAPTSVTYPDFDREIDAFITLVLDRLAGMDRKDSELAVLWADVLAERGDPEVTAWRQLEARLGFAADEAPQGLMEIMSSLTLEAGAAAVDEVAPILGSTETVRRIQALTDLAHSPGVAARFELNLDAPPPRRGETPADEGRRLAHAVRKHIGKQGGPLEDRRLAAVLNVSEKELQSAASAQAPLSLGVKKAGRVDLHFRRQQKTARRFEAARFIADHIIAPAEDRWLPQTGTSTARQKIQRAFAAELLAPIADLRAMLQDDFSQDAVEEAADYFQVSPLTVRSHLANNRLAAFGRV
jgi:hypothetical protein